MTLKNFAAATAVTLGLAGLAATPAPAATGSTMPSQTEYLSGGLMGGAMSSIASKGTMGAAARADVGRY